MFGLLHQARPSAQMVNLPQLNTNQVENKRLHNVLRAHLTEAPGEEFHRLKGEPVLEESPIARNLHGDTLSLNSKK